MSKERGIARNPLVWVASAGYLAGLLALVFTPISWALNRLTVRIYVWYQDARLPRWGLNHPLPEDFGLLLNVLMFIPLGALLVVVIRRSPLWATALAVALSGGIEFAQGHLISYRQASIADVVTNGLGGLIGALLAWAWMHRVSAAESQPESAAPPPRP